MDHEGDVEVVGGADVAEGMEAHELEIQLQGLVAEFAALFYAEVHGMDISCALLEMQGIFEFAQADFGVVAVGALQVGDEQVLVEEGHGAEPHPQDGVEGAVIFLDLFGFGVVARDVQDTVAGKDCHDQPGDPHFHFEGAARDFLFANQLFPAPTEINEDHYTRRSQAQPKGGPGIPVVLGVKEYGSPHQDKKGQSHQKNEFEGENQGPKEEREFHGGDFTVFGRGKLRRNCECVKGGFTKEILPRRSRRFLEVTERNGAFGVKF